MASPDINMNDIDDNEPLIEAVDDGSDMGEGMLLFFLLDPSVLISTSQLGTGYAKHKVLSIFSAPKYNHSCTNTFTRTHAHAYA